MVRLQLDSMTFKVFSNLSNSMILFEQRCHVLFLLAENLVHSELFSSITETPAADPGQFRASSHKDRPRYPNCVPISSTDSWAHENNVCGRAPPVRLVITVKAYSCPQSSNIISCSMSSIANFIFCIFLICQWISLPQFEHFPFKIM